MAIEERIQQRVQRLPPSMRAEVLDFVEYLVVKAQRQEEADWAMFSLSFAMRGMEDETDPVYTAADLKVMFT